VLEYFSKGLYPVFLFSTHASKSDKNSDSYATIPFTKQKDVSEESLTDQNLVLQVLAYIDVYVKNKMLTKASKILTKNCDLLKRTNVSMPYNLFIEYYVSNGNLAKIFEMYRVMKENSVTPGAQTYALMFQVIARLKQKESQESE